MESEEAILMSTLINLAAILLDAITIGVYTSNRPFKFPTFMLIVNLLIRPITSLLLLRYYNERSGRYNDFTIPGFSDYGASRRSGFGAEGTTGTLGRSAYEDIDNRPYQQAPSHQDTAAPTRDLFDNKWMEKR